MNELDRTVAEDMRSDQYEVVAAEDQLDEPASLPVVALRELWDSRAHPTSTSMPAARALSSVIATIAASGRENHVLMKLGLRDRLHAVVFAYESGLIQPGEQGA